MKIETRETDALIPYGRNQKKHDEKQVQNVANSIKRFGWTQPIVVDKKGVVVIGHCRLLAAKKLGMAEVPVVVADDLSEDEIRELRIADNKTNESGWDYEALKIDLDELKFEGFDFDWGGFEAESEEKAEALEDDDFESEPPEKPKAKPGDIYALGKHRLMCGDSANAEDVRKLMGGGKADIAFTSPPYGAADSSKIRQHYKKGKDWEKSFYNEYDDKKTEWKELLDKAFANMRKHADMQFLNIQMLADNKRMLAAFVAENAKNLVDVMVWDKTKAPPQMQCGILNNQFEFIFIFGKEEASRTIEYGSFHGTESNLFQIATGQNEYADIHRAVFPVALPEHILRMNDKAKSVLDLFGGTGTTIIAAEQAGKQCYMMELDPKYVDVIIARWEKFTGQKAELANA